MTKKTIRKTFLFDEETMANLDKLGGASSSLGQIVRDLINDEVVRRSAGNNDR